MKYITTMAMSKTNIHVIRKIFGTIFILVIVLILVGSIMHATYYKDKKEQIQPYGEMVDVYDGKMHLYKMGNKEKTIVLLPGLGDALPSADFGPLMRSLSQNYTVVCVEYFGVGFSSQTKRERTCDNYVEEIRTALSALGLQAPYILMPHSISSVYGEYYAAKYPDEVSAIISLDGTSTAYIGKDMPGFVKSLLGVSKIQQNIGLTSVLGSLTVNRSTNYTYGYTKKEIDDLVTLAGFSMNENVLEQMRNSTEYIKEANALEYPKNVPYFKIISSQTYETPNSQISVSPQEYQMDHLKRVGAQEHFEILDGTHFIYQNNAQKISEITDDFIQSLEK